MIDSTCSAIARSTDGIIHIIISNDSIESGWFCP